MAQTVALPDFQNLRLDQVIDTNFDMGIAFWRAIKVFLFAYTGYEDYCPQLYAQKFDEYVNAMKELYGFPNPNMNYVTDIKNVINSETVDVVVGIKKVRGLWMTRNLRVILTVGSEVSPQINLRMNSEVQDHMCHRQYTYSRFQRYKIQNRQIKYTLIADDWVDNQGQLQEFSINFGEISAEGFEDWFYFGRGVHMLIKIIFLSTEQNINQPFVSKFHLHTLYAMIARRFLQYNQLRSTIDKLHRPNASKSKMTYIRKRVDPNTEEAFWSTGRSLQQILQRIRTEIVEKGSDNYSQMGVLLGKAVKYADIQISMHFEEEYEDTICLCSEWCNWNAFFHLNSIYRSLLVNHNQIYLRDKTNVADMYLFSAITVLYLADSNVSAGQPLQKTPVLQLISRANDYRKINYNRYYMKVPNWRQAYRQSQPPYEFLIGLSYKILKESNIIPEVVIQSATDPFADICFENIFNYYKVLSDLHSLVSLIHWFVPQNLLKKWFKEFDKMSRENFNAYAIISYATRMRDQNTGYDFLFSEDYEYSNIFIESDGERQVKKIRDMVHKFEKPENPLNMRVTLEPLIATFASIYKLLTKVEPMLSKAKSTKSLNDIFEFCKQFDDDFYNYSQNFKFDFYTDLEEMVSDPSQIQIFKHYYVFYTLKLYLMAFGVQKYCINSLIKYNEYSSENFEIQVCPEFTFIWEHTIIENRFRVLYNENLFVIPHEIGPNISDFYTTFWGQAAHELNAATATLHQCIDSGFFQYQRLYFWWRNGGDDRPKFKRIIDVLKENQKTVAKRTQEIYSIYILESIDSIKEYDYFLEVLDVLVYYLIKAYSSVILCTISAFMKPLHELQVEQLVNDECSFTLTKPGWVPLFRTMNQTFGRLDKIQQKFIVFDDENNRIMNTISETKALIKSIYKDFYQKLLIEWNAELANIYPLSPPYRNATYFINLHMVSGLSFLCAFIDDFRSPSYYNRKVCLKLLDAAPNRNLNQQVSIHACAARFRNYLKDHNAIQEAKPFLSTIWQNTFVSLFNQFNQRTGQQMNIDLNEADNFI